MDDLYNCFSCDAINRASRNAWCCCGGIKASLVCEKCGRCFCDAPSGWKKSLWERIDMRRDPKPIDLTRPVILIVDDDRVIHSVAARVLADFPGTVLHAYDGQEGLLMATDVRPDLVITDCLMPLVDGREVARALKSNPATSGIRVIAMTSLYRGIRYRLEAYNDFHVDEYIEKPITAARLREIALATLAAPAAECGGEPAVLR